MPSQKKTKNLKLNLWQENEYPKMVDFNDDNQKIDDAFGNIEQKVTEGVENLDVAGKQIEFAEASTRTLPKTGDTLKVIVSKLTKFLSDLKKVAFTGKYSDLTGIPTSFPPSAHNHDDIYLGKSAKAESAKRADIATTAEQVQGFKFRNQNGKLEVLVEGKWIGVGGRQYTVVKRLNGPKVEYSGGPGILKYITVIADDHKIESVTVDGVPLSFEFSTTYNHEAIYPKIYGFPVTTNFFNGSRYATATVGFEFKNSFKVEGTGSFLVVAQTEK